MRKKIPDRWEDYTPIGRRIEGTRFIAFKVPLEEEVFDNIKPSRQLSISKVIENIPELGLVIDLTDTTRYYNPTEFEKEGIQYQKIRTPGQVTPREPLLKRFCYAVKDFLQENKNNDKLIGVHCTHGVNRTGYYICYHLIEVDNLEPEKAIEKFQNARGHPIERENYIKSLYLKYKAKQDRNMRKSDISSNLLSWRAQKNDFDRKEIKSSRHSSSTSWRDKPDDSYIPYYSRRNNLSSTTEQDRERPNKYDSRKRDNTERSYRHREESYSRGNPKYRNDRETFVKNLKSFTYSPKTERSFRQSRTGN